MVRLYRPRAEILNSTWKFPEARAGELGTQRRCRLRVKLRSLSAQLGSPLFSPPIGDILSVLPFTLREALVSICQTWATFQLRQLSPNPCHPLSVTATVSSSLINPRFGCRFADSIEITMPLLKRQVLVGRPDKAPRPLLVRYGASCRDDAPCHRRKVECFRLLRCHRMSPYPPPHRCRHARAPADRLARRLLNRLDLG